MYVLDTCVVRELFKAREQSPVAEWISKQETDLFYVSVLTLGEIQKGIAKLPDSHKKQIITSWFQNDFLKEFETKILSVDFQIALKWGKLCGELEKIGRKLPVIDGLIACTTLIHNGILVTRNENDFVSSGVQILNPWTLK